MFLTIRSLGLGFSFLFCFVVVLRVILQSERDTEIIPHIFFTPYLAYLPVHM